MMDGYAVDSILARAVESNGGAPLPKALENRLKYLARELKAIDDELRREKVGVSDPFDVRPERPKMSKEAIIARIRELTGG